MISVEANIGAGKSTFLKILAEKWPEIFNVIYEPLDEWQTKYADKDTNILGLFYGDIARWAYTFQSNAFMTRIQKYQREKKEGMINLTERSIFSDNKLFAENLMEDGKMNQIEWKLYENWFNWLANTFDAKPKGIIYLRCDPTIAYERVKKRSRSEEDTISQEYLTRLHEYHDNWLMNQTEIPVKVIEVTEDFEDNNEKMELMFSEIQEFLSN